MTDYLKSRNRPVATANQKFGGLGPEVPGVPVGTVDPVPTDERPRDGDDWQKSPRELTDGNPPGETFSGVDYVSAYWMGIHYGIIDPVPSAPLNLTANGSNPAPWSLSNAFTIFKDQLGCRPGTRAETEAYAADVAKLHWLGLAYRFAQGR